MRYLITTNQTTPAFTNYFDAENHFNEEIGMVVYDTLACIYTTDGFNWLDIELDSL